MRFSLSVAALFILLAFVGPHAAAQTKSQPSAPANAQPVGTATVAGRVLINKEPAAGITVILFPARQPGPVTRPERELRVKTDGEGGFLFTGVAAGRQALYAAAPAYVVANDSDFEPGITINVTEGESVTGIELELKRGGVITGRVTDAQGRPVVEEQIRLLVLDRAGKSQQFFMRGENYEMQMTDDRGVYRIHGINEGRYLVAAGAAQAGGVVGGGGGRTLYPRTFYPGTPNEAEAKVIEVTAGSEATGIDMTLPDAIATHTIAGRVVNADTNEPVMGLEIGHGTMAPDGKRLNSWTSSGTLSKANGEFQLIGVAPGRYGVFASARDGAGFFGEPVMCDATAGDVMGVEIRVRRGATVSGTAVVEGTTNPQVIALLGRVTLYLSGNTPRPFGREMNRIKPDGTFQLQGIAPGRIYLQPMNVPRGLTLVRMERDGALLQRDFEVSAGEQITGLRLVFSYGTLTQRGEVRFIGGARPQNIRMYVSFRQAGDASGPGRQAVQVDARGQFLVESLAPGDYEVRINYGPASAGLGFQYDPQLARAFQQAKALVTVSGEGGPPVTLTVDLTSKGGAQ